jgi:hypothetical protein
MGTSEEEDSGETVASKRGSAPSASALSMAVGSERYQRGRELGRGGMGRVIEAVDLQFNRVVAIKELLGAEGDRRFAAEALITGNLEHPGIPGVYERGTDAQGRPFYVMRKVKGQTVGALLGQANTMVERLRLLPAVVRTAQTLSYAHEHGVIHRDVKPDNIIVGPHGDVVLLDWGIARARGFAVDTTPGEAARTPDSTAYGAVVGTPAYMSPEQASGRTDDIDERTDVFALGALLYHLLTGRMPYSGLTVDEVLLSAREARFRPVLEVEPNVPPQLAEICLKAMSRVPLDRYRNAGELAVALEEFESNAVLARPGSRVITIAVNALTNVSVAGAVLGALLMLTRLPAFVDLGFIAWALVSLSVMGSLMSVVEFLTRGRYSLSVLAFSFALTTGCAGFAGVALDLGSVFDTLQKTLGDPVEYRRLLTTGIWESMGALNMGASLAGAQFLLWGVAQRRLRATRAAQINTVRSQR